MYGFASSWWIPRSESDPILLHSLSACLEIVFRVRAVAICFAAEMLVHQADIYNRANFARLETLWVLAWTIEKSQYGINRYTIRR